jgi:valyl-tRNA synthetase
VRADPSQQQALRTVLNAVLRMLHPITPFVTETLWPYVQATGGAGLLGIELSSNELLANAAWPIVEQSIEDHDAAATFERVQALVMAIRKLRADNQVPPRKQIRLHATPGVIELVERAGDVVPTLAGLEAVEPIAERPARAIPLAYEGEEQFLSGLVDEVDVDAERQRLEKVVAEKEKAIGGFQKRLSNPGYVNNAPEAVVQETRDRLAEAEADLAAARRALESLTDENEHSA